MGVSSRGTDHIILLNITLDCSTVLWLVDGSVLPPDIGSPGTLCWKKAQGHILMSQHKGGQLCSLFTVLDFYCTHHFCHFHLLFNANNAADGDRFKFSLFPPNSVEVWVTFSYS